MLQKLIISFLLCWVISLLHAQQFNFQTYSVGDGLAQSQVYAILEDSRGYIWMGTRGGGLSCFDGNEFTNYTVQQGLSNNYIGALLEDKEHNIWIGTNNGLCQYNGLQFEKHTIDSSQSHIVTSLFQDVDGNLWVGTNKGLYSFDGKSFTVFSDEKKRLKTRINCIFQDVQKQLWVGTRRGLYKIKKDAIEGPIFANQEIQTLAATKDSTLWIGILGQGLFNYKNGQVNAFAQSSALPSKLIQNLFTSADGKLWIGTQNKGISIWNPQDSLLQFFTEKDGLCNNNVHQILQDDWQNTWIATSGGGISKYSGQQFVHLDQSKGLNGKSVYALCEDTLGQICLSAAANGFSVYTDSTITHFGRDSGFYNIKTKAIFVDKQGHTWLGTEGKGLAVYDTLGFTFFNHENELRGKFIRDILQDSLDNIWVATSDEGISKITPIVDTIPHRYAFKHYPKRSNGLPDARINDIHLDKNNRIWYASNSKGIGYLSNGKITSIQRKDGLISNNIRSIVEDSTGYLWVGSADAGICKIPIYEDSLQIQVSEQNITSNNIYLLILDEEENLWAGSEVGVDKITLDAERNIKTIKHFGKSEGFVGIETCQNAALKDKDGNLWFGTINGLTKYNPSNTTKNTTPPKVRITDIRLFYKSLSETPYKDWIQSWNSVKDSLVFPHKQNHLEFEFLGINHPNPSKVTYEWRLLGSEENWSPRSSRNNVTYSNLLPGAYTFQLNAFNEEGVSPETPLEVSFSISPPFWQLWWFRLACLLALFLLIGSFIQARINRVRREAQRAQEQLELENNLLQLKQKALQLQMNPHFIFNALNSIQNLIAQNDHTTARYQLAKFSKLMRAILENSRSNAISLEQEIETLDHYIAIERLSSGSNFQYQIKVAPEINQEETMIPPMMIQPFVENAIIHGIAPLQEKGMILISFEQKQATIHCTIEDNGIGFEQAQKSKAKALGDGHKSAALQVTQERLDILQSTSSPSPSLDIQEIILKDGRIGGTKVWIRVPVVVEF